MSYTPLNNIILTGDPRGVTASPGDNDTSIATTEFVQVELGNYLQLAGGTMTGDIILDAGVNLQLADDGMVDWNGNASLSYDAMDDVIVSDSAIRVASAPSDDDDLTNKAYVDSVATGLDVKESVRVASQIDIDISAPGAAIDSINLSNGDRVLLKAQDPASENGIYVFNGAAVPMTRAEDANSDAEVNAGMFTFVEEGTNADQGWVLTTNNPIVLGTTALSFSQFSNAVIVSTLDSLTDVDVAGVVDGALLRYDSAGGGGWADTTNLLLDDNGRLAVSATGVNGGIMIGGDVHLYRFQADVLYTPDNVAIGSDLIMSNTDSDISFTSQDDATNQIVKSKLGSDAANRLVVQADGKMLWGSGAGAADVNLYRSSADLLKTDDSFEAVGEMYLSGTDSSIIMEGQDDAGNQIIQAKVTGDAAHRFAIEAGGEMHWGDGAGAADVNLYRQAANVLKTDDSLDVVEELYLSGTDSSIILANQDDVNNGIMTSKLGADADVRFVLGADGKMSWGDGTNAPDAVLYRSAADMLKTDDSLTVAVELLVGDPAADSSNLEDARLLFDDAVAGESAEIGFSSPNELELFCSAADGVISLGSAVQIGQGLRFSGKQTISANSTLDENTDHVVLVDVTGGAVTVTLPAAPVDGTIFQIKDMYGNAEVENITIDGNGKNIDGAASFVMAVDFQSSTVLYDAGADEWFLL